MCVCVCVYTVAAEWRGGLISLNLGMHNFELCYYFLGLNKVFIELLHYIEVTGDLSNILN